MLYHEKETLGQKNLQICRFTFYCSCARLEQTIYLCTGYRHFFRHSGVLPVSAVDVAPNRFFIGWALKNESRQSGILQAVGFVLIYVGIAAIWYAMWDATLTWEFPIPLYVVEIAYLLAIIACFVFAVILKRK